MLRAPLPLWRLGSTWSGLSKVWPDALDGRVDCLLRAADAAWLAGDPAAALALARDARGEGASDGMALQLAFGAYAVGRRRTRCGRCGFRRSGGTRARRDSAAGPRPGVVEPRCARIGQGRYDEAREAAAQAAAVAHEGQ